MVYILSGRTSPASLDQKKMLEFILRVAHFINTDPIANQFMKIIYLPNFSVRIAEILVSSSDTS